MGDGEIFCRFPLHAESFCLCQIFSRSLAAGLFLLVLNSYWLLPGFIGSSAPLGEITTSDLYAFTTKQDFNFNTLFTIVGTIYSQSSNPAQRYVESILLHKNNMTDFGEKMVLLNVKYVLLTKEVDYRGYFFLFNQTDLEFVKETPNFYLFKNNHPVSRFYLSPRLASNEQSGFISALKPLSYRRFETYLLGYIISLVALIGLGRGTKRSFEKNIGKRRITELS